MALKDDIESCKIVNKQKGEGLLGPATGSAYGIIDPDYARVFTHARIIAWQFGYACLAHGSFTRDLDLLLVPWTENACAGTIEGIVRRIADVAGLTLQGEPSDKPHGRKAWTLLFPGFNDPRWVDVSAFTPNNVLGRTKQD
jgi:hypothetical protein